MARFSRYGRLGAFGAKDAKFPLVKTVGFNEQWSLNDYSDPGYRDHIVAFQIPGYDLLDPEVIAHAEMKYDSLKAAYDAGLDSAGSTRDRLMAAISDACDKIDQQSRNRGPGGYGSAGDKQRSNFFNALNKAINDLARVVVPQVTAVDPSGNSTVITGPTIPVAVTPPQVIIRTSAPPVQPTTYKPPTTSTQGALMATGAGMPGWVMPAAVGVGTLAVGGIIFALTKKKKG